MAQPLDTSHPQAVLMKRIQQLSVEMTGSTQKPAQGMPVNLKNAEKSAGFAKDTCVVLKNLFKPADVDLDAEPDFYEEIKDDVAESGRRPSGAACANSGRRGMGQFPRKCKLRGPSGVTVG